MKKNLIRLLLVFGIISLGTEITSFAHAETGIQPEEERLEAEDSEEGGTSIKLPVGKQNRQSLAARNEKTKFLEIKRYFAQMKDGSSGSERVPMPNTDFKISYLVNGKDVFIVDKGRTNEKGEITDIPSVELPIETTALRFWYYLGNEERGYIQKYNKEKYCFVVTQTIPAASASIDYWCNFWVGSNSDPDIRFYNFQAVRQNFYFDLAVKEYKEVVKRVNDILPGTVPFEVKPINVNFEKGQYVDRGNGFWRNGYDKGKVPDITIGDKSNRDFSESSVKHNIMHEWTHWNYYRETQAGIPGTEVNSFGYREGWAYLVGYVFARDYDLSEEDLFVQNDNQNGVNRYFGKPTITTAKQVLYDLLDVDSIDEDFSLSQRFIDSEMSELEQRKLNLGIMHSIMVESKATTLKEFLNYMEGKYVLLASDKKKYEKVLAINGLSRDGDYTLNEDGSPRNKAINSSQLNESQDGLEEELQK